MADGELKKNKLPNSGNNSTNGNSKQEQVGKRTFWDRIPKYKWWVTPLNILLICIFLIVIDIITKPTQAIWPLDWAWWAVGGLLFAYATTFILFKRPTIAWIVGPLLMLGTSGLLLAIDLIVSPEDGFHGIYWSAIPIAALLTFGVLIPIVAKFGRKKEKPIEKFRKALSEMEADQVNEDSPSEST